MLLCKANSGVGGSSTVYEIRSEVYSGKDGTLRTRYVGDGWKAVMNAKKGSQIVTHVVGAPSHTDKMFLVGKNPGKKGSKTVTLINPDGSRGEKMRIVHPSHFSQFLNKQYGGSLLDRGIERTIMTIKEP